MENKTLQFDFDDILIVPSKITDISSRYKNIRLPSKLPLITAPMDTVVNLENMCEFKKNGIDVALPRTIKYDEFLKYKRKNNLHSYNNVFISLGFEDLDLFGKENYFEFVQGQHILIDVANGHMVKIVYYAKEIKKHRPDIKIMVGNIGNPETYRWYAENDCVDYIRVGIGNGGGCLTTKQSGVGYPMASLIHNVYLEKQKFISNTIGTKKPINPPAIVADGGMKDYSDIIKSLALGADYVMVGSIFNKALESCATNYLYGIRLNKTLASFLFKHGYPVKKMFRGMSTKGAQKAMGKTSFKTSEGVTRIRKVEYRLKGWTDNFEHYLRNAMSYSDAETLGVFIGKGDIIQITSRAYDRFNK